MDDGAPLALPAMTPTTQAGQCVTENVPETTSCLTIRCECGGARNVNRSGLEVFDAIPPVAVQRANT